MGTYTQSLRTGKLHGPHARKFNRNFWQDAAKREDLDDEDGNIVAAAIFFDELLSFLRSEFNIEKVGLPPADIARLAVSMVMRNYWLLSKMMREEIAKASPKLLSVPQIQQQMLPLAGGQSFTPDEIASSAGDGIKHVFRDCLGADIFSATLKPTEQQVLAVERLLTNATLYNAGIEYWNDCVCHKFKLTQRKEGELLLIPGDRGMEIARVASHYRRVKIAMHDSLSGVAFWQGMTHDEKRRLCGVRLVGSIKLAQGRIHAIELSESKRSLNRSAESIIARTMEQDGYYARFLDEPLPQFKNLSLQNLMRGWQVLQSLAAVMVDEFSKIPVAKDSLAGLTDFAPLISTNVLAATLQRATSFNAPTADKVLTALTFSAKTGDVWTQPLIRCGPDYCLVTPCIYSIQLHRVIEGWMRQGGLDLDRRGPDFETFCRSDLVNYLQRSELKSRTIILKEHVKFKPAGELEEQIDLVIILGKTVLVAELKCILWPDESIQFANYRQTIEGAAEQIIRKRDAITRNYAAFRERLSKLGYSAPEVATVIGCVLTNSAVYVGFSIRGIAIVDLPILGKFFSNEHIKAEWRNLASGVSTKKITVSFYDKPESADAALEDYLLDPPQVRDLKHGAKSREIEFPIVHGTLGRLFHETVSIELDVSKLSATPEGFEEVDIAEA